MAEEEQDSGFTFVDKRRTNPDAPPAEPSTSQEEANDPASPSSEADASAAEPHGLPSLSVRDRLLMCIDILHQGAWISLGLIADPATGQIERDLDQAKAAIDSVAFLAGQVEHELDDVTRRELKSLVSDLQLNYVQQKNR
jgi:hypothetical protein